MNRLDERDRALLRALHVVFELKWAHIARASGVPARNIADQCREPQPELFPERATRLRRYCAAVRRGVREATFCGS